MLEKFGADALEIRINAIHKSLAEHEFLVSREAARRGHSGLKIIAGACRSTLKSSSRLFAKLP